jgi:GT2 family glycosyltransferase
LYAGWNECLKRAQGRFIYIATSDDTAHPKLITELLRLLEENPSASIARCGCQKIDSDSRAIVGNEPLYDRFISRFGDGPFQLPASTEIILMAAFGQTWGSFTQLLFRQEVFDRTGVFPTQFGISGDWAWSLRAAFTSEVVHVTEKLATWRIHSSQASATWNLDGHTVYHTLFCDFVRDHFHSASELWGWDKSAKARLLESAWQRYEENSGWFLYQLISNPRHFFFKGLQVWRSNSSLFWRRLRHGCAVPNCANGDRLQAAERLLESFTR